MTQEVMNDWVKNAKATHDANKQDVVKVVRREKNKSKGEMIMDIADKIWPSLMKMFDGVHDENGMLMQPSHVRGIALNVAQDLVNENPNQAAS